MRYRPLLFSALLAGCAGEYAPLATVPSVDIQRYLGRWYEVASVPVSQQKGCFCTTAEYSLLEEGVVRVVNRCRKNGVDGEVAEASGKAFVVPGSNNAKLRVQFFWPFRGDYWVLELDSAYTYAVVGMPSRKYFWILARRPEMPAPQLEGILGRMRERGFDVAAVQRTVHGCN